MAKLGPLTRRDSCAGEGVWDMFMTHLCMVSATVVAGVVGVVVVLELLETLVFSVFALLLGLVFNKGE